MYLRFVAGLLALATPACAMTPQGQTPEQVPVTYRCAGDVTVPVIFVNPPDSDTGYATTVIEGKLMVLPLVISASGARYRSDMPAPGYQIWTKGDDAMITKGPEDADAPVAGDCTAAK
ncbi:MliC family protein [uncultured Paracoccus sp.]|uniref:MliC family protein n=1 Tax=uncultured Paracoccus sp. TaxID=189685 RepID=UPI0026113AFF|nr:MliC family protein [uncultured Paracoccus sp.]